MFLSCPLFILFYHHHYYFGIAEICNLLCIRYDACMDVTDSDHKPVRCIFRVDIAHADESIRRQEFGNIIKSNEKLRTLLRQLCNVPETIVSTNNIMLQKERTSVLRITNKCGKHKAIFEISCEGQSTVEDGLTVKQLCARASFGFPSWLEVTFFDWPAFTMNITIPFILRIEPNVVGPEPQFVAEFISVLTGLDYSFIHTIFPIDLL